jgi:hypothetical protein
MTWRVYADVYEAGELTGTAKSQQFIPKSNQMIKAIRTILVLVGNPNFTNLKMQIYDNDFVSQGPSKLKAESITTWSTGELLKTDPHGLVEIYFEFLPFGVRKDDKYHIVLNADTYTKTDNSFIAWRNAWPDPVYKTNYTPTGLNYLASPYMITAFIGSEL